MMRVLKIMKYAFFLSIFFSACTYEDQEQVGFTFQDCKADRQDIMEVSNINATVFFFEEQGIYSLKFYPQGEEQTYDTVGYALVCSLGESLEIDGLEVMFSGRLQVLTDSDMQLFKPIPSGTEIYFLKPSKIEKIN